MVDRRYLKLIGLTCFGNDKNDHRELPLHYQGQGKSKKAIRLKIAVMCNLKKVGVQTQCLLCVR